MSEKTKSRVMGINHVALEVGDIEEALAFYGEFLIFELRSQSENMAFMDLGDQFLALSKGRRQAPDDDRHFGLVVEDKADTGMDSPTGQTGCGATPAYRPLMGRSLRRPRSTIDPSHREGYLDIVDCRQGEDIVPQG